MQILAWNPIPYSSSDVLSRKPSDAAPMHLQALAAPNSARLSCACTQGLSRRCIESARRNTHVLLLLLLSSRFAGRKTVLKMTAFVGAGDEQWRLVANSRNLNRGQNVVELRTPCLCAPPWRHAYPGTSARPG